MKWSKDQIDILINLYPNNTNIYISEILNINIPLIKKKAYSLNLHKYKEHNAKIRKDRTRDLSLENLYTIAKKYKTKSDFKKNDPSAYSAAYVIGELENVCKHMIKQCISRPQLILKYIIQKLFNTKLLYNTRKIIQPYELDINSISEITEEEIDIFIQNSILDFDNIKKICEKYTNYKEFKTKEKSLYCKLIDMKCIKEYTKHMYKNIRFIR